MLAFDLIPKSITGTGLLAHVAVIKYLDHPLRTFGLFEVTSILVFLCARRPRFWHILGFAGACALGSAYGFLQGRVHPSTQPSAV